MTTRPSVPHPHVSAPVAAGPRPATVIAVLVVVLLHAVLLLGGTVASGISLAAFVLTHPTSGWTPATLVPTAFGTLLSLVLATGAVVLVLQLWRAARRSRVLLSVLLGVSALVDLGGIVSAFTRVRAPSIPFATLWVLELVTSAAAVVLLWLAPTSTWLRQRSVGPARPGL